MAAVWIQNCLNSNCLDSKLAVPHEATVTHHAGIRSGVTGQELLALICSMQ